MPRVGEASTEQINVFPMSQEAPPSASAAGQSPSLPNPEEALNAGQANYPGAAIPAEGRRGEVAGQDTALPPAGRNMTGMTSIRLGPGQPEVLMPTAGVRGANEAEKQARIAAYVNEGKVLYDQIMSGETTRPANGKEDLTKLMWYLQALASSKAAASSGGEGMALFREGAVFVEDPNGNLERFLLDSNSYSRSSSHLRDFQQQGQDYRSHGVDIRKTETPNERKTILFQRLPQQTQGENAPAGTGAKRMLFLKMEEHGCRGLSKGGTGRGPAENVSAWKSVKRFFANIADTVAHGLGFITSLRQRSGNLAITGQNNRERVPKDAVRSYAALLERARGSETSGVPADDAARTRATMTQLLTQGNPHLSDSIGIRGMVANLRAAVAEGEAHNLNDDPLLQDCRDLLERLQRQGDHPDLRIGNEVILTREEMNVPFSAA
jgi:hypothetical protein